MDDIDFNLDLFPLSSGNNTTAVQKELSELSTKVTEGFLDLSNALAEISKWSKQASNSHVKPVMSGDITVRITQVEKSVEKVEKNMEIMRTDLVKLKVNVVALREWTEKALKPLYEDIRLFKENMLAQP